MTNNFIKNTQGMSLIETSIALLVLAIIMVPIGRGIDQWRAKKNMSATLASNQSIDNAIEEFYFVNNRYPCPSTPGLTITDPNYGVENCQGADNWDGTNDGVLVGEVPFASLSIPDDLQLDGWKKRITYAVTWAYSDDGSTAGVPITPNFAIAPQVIVMRNAMKLDPITLETVCDVDGANNPVTETRPSHYITISHGKNGVGANSAEGGLGTACPAGGLTTLESENCDGDATFFHQQCAATTANAFNTFTGAIDMLDDIGLSRESAPSALWPPSSLDPNDGVTPLQRVGIGQDDPIFPLDVVGRVMTSNGTEVGNITSNEFCTNDLDAANIPTTCFRPALIVGNEPDMDCGNLGIIQLSENAFTCGGGSQQPADSCAIGEFLTGYDASGGVICIPKI